MARQLRKSEPAGDQELIHEEIMKDFVCDSIKSPVVFFDWRVLFLFHQSDSWYVSTSL